MRAWVFGGFALLPKTDSSRGTSRNSKRRCASTINGLLQRPKSFRIEDTRKVDSHYVRDEEGTLLRNPNQILARWGRLFSTLLNAKSDNLNPDMAAEVPQQPTAHGLGDEPTVEEVSGVEVDG